LLAPAHCRPLRRPEHRATALCGTAAAGIDLVHVRRIVLLAADLVVVAELLAAGDRLDRVDEHAALLDGRLAIRVALVIDEARVVAADAGVDDRALVDDEQERVVVVLVVVLVTLVRFLVRDALAEILVEAFSLLDVAQCECAVTVYGRMTHFVERMDFVPAGSGTRM